MLQLHIKEKLSNSKVYNVLHFEIETMFIFEKAIKGN